MMRKNLGRLLLFCSAIFCVTICSAAPSRNVYDQYNRYQGRYSTGPGDSYNYYDNRNVYQGRYTPNIGGGYNKYNSRNTYQGRGYQIPASKGKGR